MLSASEAVEFIEFDVSCPDASDHLLVSSHRLQLGTINPSLYGSGINTSIRATASGHKPSSP
jgi:hypothetical protein